MLYSCTHMATVGVKGLKDFEQTANNQNKKKVVLRWNFAIGRVVIQRRNSTLNVR